jgi:hypothetical protein
MNNEDVNVRRDICQACGKGCPVDLYDSCAACEFHKWGQIDCGQITGAGDIVATIADPIAKFIGLNKKKCGCGKKRAGLNSLLPIKRKTPV